MRGPDRDWFEAEQPTRTALVAELRRLARRARSRWIVIVVLAAGLTAGVLWRRARKVKVHDASVVMSVTEGTMADRNTPVPVHELRDYILTVLLSDEVLAAEIEARDLSPLRRTHGMPFAIAELRDSFEVHVWRNFFLYEYAPDAPRSARIAIEFFDADPNFAWEMANRLATLVIEREQARRLETAQRLAAEAAVALDEVRRRVAALEAQVADRTVALVKAQQQDERGRAAALLVEVGELNARLHREEEVVLGLTQLANADQQAEAIDRAGLGLQFVIAETTGAPVEEPGASLYFRILVGAALFCALLPLVGLFIGAFDTRVHDREDLERLGLPVLGHLPGFPGDEVGSLRARGVRGRRVTS